MPSLETAARSIDSKQIAIAVTRSVATVQEGKGTLREPDGDEGLSRACGRDDRGG